MNARLRGFTLVELVVVITVIVILLALGVVSMTSIQPRSRDAERQQRVEAIARALETRYANGNPTITGPSTNGFRGTYPSVQEAKHIDGQTITTFTPNSVSGGYRLRAYPGTSERTFKNPGGTNAWTYVCEGACSSPTAAGDASSTQITSRVSASLDRYVYQPVTSAGNVCLGESDGCVKFNIYWRSEVDGTIKTIKSMRQQ